MRVKPVVAASMITALAAATVTSLSTPPSSTRSGGTPHQPVALAAPAASHSNGNFGACTGGEVRRLFVSISGNYSDETGQLRVSIRASADTGDFIGGIIGLDPFASEANIRSAVIATARQALTEHCGVTFHKKADALVFGLPSIIRMK